MRRSVSLFAGVDCGIATGGSANIDSSNNPNWRARTKAFDTIPPAAPSEHRAEHNILFAGRERFKAHPKIANKFPCSISTIRFYD